MVSRDDRKIWSCGIGIDEWIGNVTRQFVFIHIRVETPSMQIKEHYYVSFIEVHKSIGT